MWYWILVWLLIVLIVIGNGLVICLIISNWSFYMILNWFVFLLVFVDFGVGFIYFFFFFVLNVNNLDGLLEINRIFFLVLCIFFYLLVINFFVMIFDCYVVIVYLLKYFNVMRMRIIVMFFVLVWFVLIFIFSLFFVFNFKDNRKFFLVFWVILF